jgi:hypothetical protein
MFWNINKWISSIQNNKFYVMFCIIYQMNDDLNSIYLINYSKNTTMHVTLSPDSNSIAISASLRAILIFGLIRFISES